jgi:two-component system sensor histidine kinase ArlS
VIFSSLRWRIATFYALLLLAVIGVVTVVLTFQLRSILLDEARAKIDSVAADIGQLVRGQSALSAIGDAASIEQELTATGSLDHWAGPTTFVEVDTAKGYPEAKSTNMGSATFATPVADPKSAVAYRIETRPGLGDVMVRQELIRYPGVELYVQVGESLAIYGDTIARVRELLLIVLVLAAIVVIAGSVAIASSAVEPIGRLNAAMGEIRSDQLSRRLGWSGRRDEIGSLAQSFDAMLDRLEGGFARERQFISDASHELKTPLTVINANAQMLQRWGDRDPETRAESLKAIGDESASLASMVNGMLLLAKAESGDDIPREPVALHQAVAEAVRTARPRAEEKRLTLELVPRTVEGTGPLVLGDATLLQQLFTNLIDNAIKFTEFGGIAVRLEGQGERVEVAVLDSGVGIDNDSIERVFDRFFRADPSRNRAIPGTGLGLAIVRSIARVHDGTVTVAQRPEGGTVFRVSLPLLTSRS